LCRLAAAHAFGLTRNHPFTDGNTRTAWVLARTFLALNAVEIVFSAVDAVSTVQSLAAGALTADELADWFRQHVRVV
jgi:death-on-curing protein